MTKEKHAENERKQAESLIDALSRAAIRANKDASELPSFAQAVKDFTTSKISADVKNEALSALIVNKDLYSNVNIALESLLQLHKTQNMPLKNSRGKSVGYMKFFINDVNTLKTSLDAIHKPTSQMSTTSQLSAAIKPMRPLPPIPPKAKTGGNKEYFAAQYAKNSVLRRQEEERLNEQTRELINALKNPKTSPVKLAEHIAYVSTIKEKTNTYETLNPEAAKALAEALQGLDGEIYRKALQRAYLETDILGKMPDFIAGPKQASEKKLASKPFGGVRLFQPKPSGQEQTARALKGGTAAPAPRAAEKQPDKEEFKLPSPTHTPKKM